MGHPLYYTYRYICTYNVHLNDSSISFQSIGPLSLKSTSVYCNYGVVLKRDRECTNCSLRTLYIRTDVFAAQFCVFSSLILFLNTDSRPSVKGGPLQSNLHVFCTEKRLRPYCASPTPRPSEINDVNHRRPI